MPNHSIVNYNLKPFRLPGLTRFSLHHRIYRKETIMPGLRLNLKDEAARTLEEICTGAWGRRGSPQVRNAEEQTVRLVRKF